MRIVVYFPMILMFSARTQGVTNCSIFLVLLAIPETLFQKSEMVPASMAAFMGCVISPFSIFQAGVATTEYSPVDGLLLWAPCRPYTMAPSSTSSMSLCGVLFPGFIVKFVASIVGVDMYGVGSLLHAFPVLSMPSFLAV